jgi:mono/diheme cytochrome c family protein
MAHTTAALRWSAALAVGLSTAGAASAQDTAAGRAVAERYCAACHNVGDGVSPVADAPPFATLKGRYGAGGLAELLEKGMIKDRPHPLEEGARRVHPRMPALPVSEDEVVALAAYLRTFETAEPAGTPAPR